MAEEFWGWRGKKAGQGNHRKAEIGDKEMKRYTHWLKICGNVSTQDEARQYQEIQNYIDRYPNANATIYLYDYALVDRAVKLECSQSWNDLDLNANTGSHQLRRLTGKPANISNPRSFFVPERLSGQQEAIGQYDINADLDSQHNKDSPSLSMEPLS